MFFSAVLDINRVAAVIQAVVQKDGVLSGMLFFSDLAICRLNNSSCERFEKEWYSSWILALLIDQMCVYFYLLMPRNKQRSVTQLLFRFEICSIVPVNR